MTALLKQLRLSVRVWWTMPQVLGQLVVALEDIHDQIHALKLLTIGVNEARLLRVPCGMTPEQAWEHARRGQPLTTRPDDLEVCILLDPQGNLLKVMERS